MSAVHPSADLYAQLTALPENKVGEIIDLYTQSPPKAPPAVTALSVLMSVGPP